MIVVPVLCTGKNLRVKNCIHLVKLLRNVKGYFGEIITKCKGLLKSRVEVVAANFWSSSFMETK